MANRDRGVTRDRSKLLVSKIIEAEEIVKEARGRESNTRYDAILGFVKYINNLGEDMGR